MNYRNPIYTESGLIDCEIEHPVYGWIPFTCGFNDRGAQFDTAALFVKMKPHAELYTAPPAPSEEEVAVALAEQIRTERGYLLAASDWTQVADAPVNQAAWAVYRQALRDIPSQESFPHSVVWPDKP